MADLESDCIRDPIFANWIARNTQDHRLPGYRIVTLSLKATGFAPGDITAEQLELLAELADLYSFGEIRNTHQQNMVLGDVQVSDPLRALAAAASRQG